MATALRAAAPSTSPPEGQDHMSTLDPGPDHPAQKKVSRETPLEVRRYLAVEHVAPVAREQPPWAMDKLLGVLARVWRPATVRFIVTAGAGEPVQAGWEVIGRSLDAVEGLAADLHDATRSLAPWLGLSDPKHHAPWPALGAPSHHFLAGRSAGGVLVAGQALAWPVAERSADRWALSVELLTLPGPEPLVASFEPGEQADADWSGRAVTCRVRLHGSGRQRELLAALVAEDADGPVSLVAAPSRRDPDGITVLPVRTVAHLLSTPARVRSAFPEHPPSTPDALLALILGSPSPHVLVAGASGQGKTTLMLHLAVAGMKRGAVPLFVDVEDGHSTAALAQECHGRGLRPLTLSFIGPRPVSLGLTCPPPGISAELWVDHLHDLLKSVLWDGMPEEYFGPVAQRVLRILLSALVRDPAGPRPLSDLVRLLDPDDDAFRDQLLDRIGDPGLERSLRAEVLPMIRHREAGNTVVFLLSKAEPLLGPAAVRAVTSAGTDTLGIEQAVAEGRPIMVHAPASELGEVASRVLVMVVLHRFWLAAQARESTQLFDVFLDEFHKYAGRTVGEVLARGRKRHVRLRLAHQHTSQLTREVRDAALGNVGVVCSFRTGPADAALLDARFPRVTGAQLQRLPSHHVAVTDGETDGVHPSPPPWPDRAV